MWRATLKVKCTCSAESVFVAEADFRDEVNLDDAFPARCSGCKDYWKRPGRISAGCLQSIDVVELPGRLAALPGQQAVIVVPCTVKYFVRLNDEFLIGHDGELVLQPWHAHGFDTEILAKAALAKARAEVRWPNPYPDATIVPSDSFPE